MIYLASVYSLDAKTDSEEHRAIREERYNVVMKKVSELMAQNVHVFSPILHCHVLSNTYKLPKDFDYWKKLDEDYISHCDAVCVLKMEGWERSQGISEEIKYANQNGIPVEYLEV